MTAEHHHPAWVCADCGNRYGLRACNPHATWHEDVCDICKKRTIVTEPRDFGHLDRSFERAVSKEEPTG